MTSPDPVTPQPAPSPRRLTRSSSDQMLGGVAGGLGRYFDVDPILFRVGFPILALAGGAGLLAYLALWLLVPDEEGRLERPDAGRALLIAGGALLVLLLVGLLPGPGFLVWPGFLGLAALALLAYVVIRAGGGDEDARSRLARALLVVLAVVLALVAGLCAAIGTAYGGGAVVAAIVIACGLALVAGAFRGRGRWLLVPALVLAIPAAVVEAADLRVTGGIGAREYRPASVGELRDDYRLGVGEMVIDLRYVDFPAGRTDLRVDMGAGLVEILVPEDVCVSSRADVGVGTAHVFGLEEEGVDVEWSQVPRNAAQAPELVVDADLDVGAFVIRHGDAPGLRGPEGPWRDWEPFPGDGAQVACAR